MEKCKNRWERVAVREAPVGKSLADFAGVPQRADPVYNSCPLFQSSAHVYSFWHQGQKADRSVFTEAPQFSQQHANEQHYRDAKRQLNAPEASCSNKQFAQISILSLCLWSVFKMQLKRCWYDLWAPRPRGQVLNPLQPRRVQHHKRHMLFRSCHPRSPRHPGTQVLFFQDAPYTSNAHAATRAMNYFHCYESN